MFLSKNIFLRECGWFQLKESPLRTKKKKSNFVAEKEEIKFSCEKQKQVNTTLSTPCKSQEKKTQTTLRNANVASNYRNGKCAYIFVWLLLKNN